MSGIGTIAVTGGTGRVGGHLVRALLDRGHRLRVITPDAPPEDGRIEWYRTDFRESLDFDETLEGCDAVLHLGAELNDMPPMRRVNGDATRALVEAAERQGVRFFAYTSSICVYGSPKTRLVTEDSPLIATGTEDAKDYLAPPFLVEYGKSKLLGEVAIREAARDAAYVIFRPTAISAEHNILGPKGWSLPRKVWRGYRHSHQVYVHDVVAAIIHFMDRAFEGAHRPGVETYNLSNDDLEDNSYAYFFDKAYKATGVGAFRCPFVVPGWLDLVKDLVKFKSREWRYPLGMVLFSPARLYATGYRHPTGVMEAHERAIRAIERPGAAAPVAAE